MSDEDDDSLASSEDEEMQQQQQQPMSKKSSKKRSGGAGTSSAKQQPKKKKRFDPSSMIDDAAVLSGSDDEDEEDEEEDEENNKDYVLDDFVVNEVEPKNRATDGLEDSDDDDDDDDSDDGGGGLLSAAARRKKKVRKLRDTDRLDEDDLALIDEARGVVRKTREELDREAAMEQHRIKARSEAELRKELFDTGGASDEERRNRRKENKRSANNRRTNANDFDEDGMDEFIDYGDDEGGQRRFRDDDEGLMGGRDISEAQLSEANDIFGTDFLDFMGGDDNNEEDDEDPYASKRKFRERGVGVDLGMDSDEDLAETSDDDDDDLFASDPEDETSSGLTKEERAEALRLKREKRRMDKIERRKAAARKKAERRRAKLRRAFEPVQLVENFCTERDDEIRGTDVPERYFDFKTAFHGPTSVKENVHAPFSMEEEEEAEWMMNRIPDITAEYAEIAASSSTTPTADVNSSSLADADAKERAIIHSIIMALRYMHRDKLEPDFIRLYRVDYVTSPAVRNNLHLILDEDVEWGRLIHAKEKVKGLLDQLQQSAHTDAQMGADEENVRMLREELDLAQSRLDDSTKDEERIKSEIGDLEKGDDEDDDVDDELFGDDEEDDEEEKTKKKQEVERKKESLSSHLKTTQSLVQVCAEQVAQATAALKLAEEKSAAANPNKSHAKDASQKICHEALWNIGDYQRLVQKLKDHREVMDVYKYLSLVKEGTDAVRSKTVMGEDGTEAGTTEAEKKKKKRSRRFDRDYYRTCVSQGLRKICYKFSLSPFRAGIKLEDNNTLVEGFNWEKSLPGENVDDELGADPRRWNAPTVEDADPTTFATDLVSSGELVLLSSSLHPGDDDADNVPPEVNDPLRGCRYVAARELAQEPRIRKHLRQLYRSRAVLSTRPTSKGLDNIDPFHEYYGLNLIKNKSINDHFPMSEKDMEMQKMGLDANERKEWDEKMKCKEKDSCIQYMNILKSERGGHLKQCIHLPFTDGGMDDDWYKKGDEHFTSRGHQDDSLLYNELEKIYLPTNPDSDEWNSERHKILRFALTNFLLPQFETEVKRDLREAAIKVAITAAGCNLMTMAMEGPYRPSHLLGENRFLAPTGDLPIVGVCCSADGKEATYLAAISEKGEMMDHLAVPAGTQIDSPKMSDKVITFLIQSRPSAIIVGSHAGLSCRLVARKLGALTTQATERWNNRFIQGQEEDDDEYETRMEEFRRMFPHHDDEDDDDANGPSSSEWKCNVEMVDDHVAQLFGRSVRGKKEFPDSAINLKCAVAIGRHAKNPLAELTYTWGVASDAGVFGTEMLYLNIHPLQSVLPKTMLLREYERVLSRSVSDVGADLNLSCKYDHLLGMLTFVPGLGPRKAASIKNSLDRLGGVVSSRRDILAKRLVGPIVYNNAVAFLRIRDMDALNNQLLHPLDDTRLHPDVYIRNSWATKIAIDALEMDNGDMASNADREDRAISAIRDIIQDSHNEIQRLFDATKTEWEHTFGPTFNVGAWDPRINVPQDRWRDKVDELDLDTFAEMIEGTGLGKWLTHLTMIKWEFRLPFTDPRKPMEPLDRDKLFRLLTGENDQSLCPGKEVTGKVVRISDFGAHLKLEGDVPAFIPLRNLSDGHVESVEDVVQIGSIVTAIVTEVKKDHMSVDLSMKMDDVRKDPSSWERPSSLPALDACFDRRAASNIEQGKSKAREERFTVALSALTGGDESMASDTALSQGRTKRVTRRACAHPAFRNATHAEIEQELKDGGEAMVGEALIRPSSKIADSLAVHWLVRANVIKVVEVNEEDKDNDASIGNTLKIKNEVYGSIDELLARFIAPMNDRVEELVHHRKFLNLPEAHIDKKLRDMKAAVPGGIFYFLCWNEKYPGYASLRFILNTTPRNHHIGITPDGFAWYKKTYANLDLLLNSFKKNPHGASNTPSSSMRSSSSTASSSSIRNPSSSNSSRPSRWGAKSQSTSATTTHQPPPPSTNPGGWGAPPQQPITSVGGWGSSTSNTRPPPPPPQYARPAPPPLPPQPQNSYPPAPPTVFRQQ